MKIDLQEIAKRAAHIKKHIENENAIKDPDLRYSYKLPLLACEEVVNALEQLPKLVEALQLAKEQYNTPRKIITSDNVVTFLGHDWIALASKTLEPFTTKTEPNA